MDTAKEALGAELRKIRSEHPGALRQYPMPESIQQQPTPVTIRLAAWAVDIARQLDERFGAVVELSVGMLEFPSQEPFHRGVPPQAAPVSAEQIEVIATSDLQVRSGHHLETTVTVRNQTNRPLQLTHPGGDRSLYGEILDPVTGEIVNGHIGMAPLTADLTTDIPPGDAANLRLRAYTDSRLPRLGYALPPGTWDLRARLTTADGHHLRSAVMPLRITLKDMDLPRRTDPTRIGPSTPGLRPAVPGGSVPETV